MDLSRMRTAVRAMVVALCAMAAAPPPAIEHVGSGLLYVPSTATTPAPLLVMLHGAGQQPEAMIELLRAEADRRGFAVFAPKSQKPTWDIIDLAQEDQSGHDFRVMKAPYARSSDALRLRKDIDGLAKRSGIDPAHIVIAGYSDGASMALALGLDRRVPANGIVAFAPGMSIIPDLVDYHRRVIIAHGRSDKVILLGIDCHEIVQPLRDRGVSVAFRPFDGGHEVPAAVLAEALDNAVRPAPGQAPLPLAAQRCS